MWHAAAPSWARVITGRPVMIAAAFAAEQPVMLPLPAEPFDPARLLQARVDHRAPPRAAHGLREPAPARRRRSRASFSDSEVMGCPAAC